MRKKKPVVCSKCGAPGVRGQRRCLVHHAEAMREWRKTHPMTKEQRVKDNARSFVAVYLKRGHLKRGLCEVCNSSKVQAHHDDYSKPLSVRWLCRLHHLQHHGKMLS